MLLNAQPAHANPSFVVTSTDWSSPTGIKAAIDYANAKPGTHITFAIPTSDAGYVIDPQHGGYFRIIAQDTLSVIASGTFIDGDSQRLSPAGDTNPWGPRSSWMATTPAGRRSASAWAAAATTP